MVAYICYKFFFTFFFLLVFVWTAYQTVSLSDRMGGVIIQASIEQYQCDIFRWCGLELEV